MHPSHADQLGKLNRAIGQVEAVRRMIDDEKYCIDIITQLRAARSALKAVELGILKTHMASCLSKACCSDDVQKDTQISEIITLLKKYE